MYVDLRASQISDLNFGDYGYSIYLTVLDLFYCDTKLHKDNISNKDNFQNMHIPVEVVSEVSSNFLNN